MNSDFKDLLQILGDFEVEYLIYYLSKQDLIKSKKAAGRAQDLADIEELIRANP